MKYIIIIVFGILITLDSFSQNCLTYFEYSLNVGYWPMDNNSGLDLGYNLNNGILHNTSGVSGACDPITGYESSIYFNGVDSYMDIPSSTYPTGYKDFTYSMWYMVDTIKSGTLIFIGSYVDSNFIKLYFNDSGHLSFGIRDMNYSTSFISTINQWHHITLTKKDSLVLFYLNGIKFDSTIIDDYNIQFTDIRFGGDGVSESFRGRIDHVKIYEVCYEPIAVTFNYLDVVAVSVNKPKTNLFSVYPNPCSDKVMIESDKIIKVFDFLNREVYSTEGGGLSMVDVSKWLRGIYSVVSDGGIRRLVIE